MKVEIFLDEGEEYPQLFSVWKIDSETGYADLTTRRNYVDAKKERDSRFEIDAENIRLLRENAELRKFGRDLLRRYFMPIGIDSDKHEKELLKRAIDLGVAKDYGELAMIKKGE